MVRGRRTKRIRVNDEGRPTGGEVYTRGGAFKFKWMIEVEGPVTMHSSNSGGRAANEADLRQRRGPANRRRSVHAGGGAKGSPLRQKKCEKICLKKKFNKKNFFFSSGIFFHHFS